MGVPLWDRKGIVACMVEVPKGGCLVLLGHAAFEEDTFSKPF